MSVLSEKNKNNKKKMVATILFGFDVDNTDIYQTSVSLQIATQKYILPSKHFKAYN